MEICSWSKIDDGYQFRREGPILDYIVEFACLELLLVIEVDGWTHDSEKAIVKDQMRDEILASIGFTTLRFSSWEVLNKLTDVSQTISNWIEENKTCLPKGNRTRDESS